ncbi:MAG TPA: adenylosuccinate synthetase, partial [Chitinophagaceae bacterium]|nr:adenylosuccinate synthetase [Chitinophagaceae bacterium]
LGVAPQKINQVLGVTKAYCTRVGGGPFPTELDNAVGEQLRKAGNEFGATTGRPRRCGWVDLVALKYTCILNGVTKVIMTKADVLDAFEELKLCTAYKINGEEKAEVPFQMMRVAIEPVYKCFAGWNTDSTKIKEASLLPSDMSAYIKFINEYIGAPVKYVSNGPGREQIISL